MGNKCIGPSCTVNNSTENNSNKRHNRITGIGFSPKTGEAISYTAAPMPRPTGPNRYIIVKKRLQKIDTTLTSLTNRLSKIKSDSDKEELNKKIDTLSETYNKIYNNPRDNELDSLESECTALTNKIDGIIKQQQPTSEQPPTSGGTRKKRKKNRRSCKRRKYRYSLRKFVEI